MNTRHKHIKKVIEETREAMVRDGISENYIESLSCTWNALLRYVENGNTLFSEEVCWLFLSDQYGICRKQNYLALRAIDKRRKRAILALINTWNYGNTLPRNSYHPCRFSCKCEDEALSHDSTDTTRIYMKVDVSHLKILSLNVPPLGNVWMGGAPI